MMTPRENLLSLLRRTGYEWIPVDFSLCPALEKQYKERIQSDLPYWEYFEFPTRNVEDIRLVDHNIEKYRKYHEPFPPNTVLDHWGIGHESSPNSMHMSYMHCPMRKLETLEELKAYPLPDYLHGDASHQKGQVEEIHARGLAAVGNMPCTIWETSWYLRGMEELMMDMMTEDPKAEYLLDAVTNLAVARAESYARAGVDILYLGDDIGMQRTPMMGMDLYARWLKPRLKKVIDAARTVNPNIIVFYHSCGFATPFIPHLIEAGVDVLNPIQSECMNFAEIHREYGDRLSFHGTIGTQTTMPFGTVEEVKREVTRNLDIAGEKGGLYVAPTHLLEPEVPFDNILAYVEACRNYRVKG
jgi:uroporphyrinogen decarboxylase